MILFGKSKGKRIHARNIELNTYEYDDQRLVIEGSLVEQRLYEYRIATGEKKPAGVIHHMIIRWLVNMSTFIIEDLEVEMPATPHKECSEMITSLAPIKGMKIAGGFTLKVKELVGGIRGCSHLMALLIAMAPAAVQGYAAYHSEKPTGFGPITTEVLQFLVNTCGPWREGGPLMKKYLK